MTPVQRTAADLLYLAERWDDFHEMRQRGTARPWQQPHISPQREDPGADGAPGMSAPLHLDVFDALVDLLATADDLAERVAQEAGVDRLPYPTSAMADPTPYLRHAAAHLEGIGHELLGYVAEEVSRLRSTVDRHLGELTTGQTLQAPCPWCAGGVAGGAYTLRIRQGRDEVLIVCESGVCEPPEADSGERHRGHPAWSLDREGHWLADRIDKMKESAA